MNIEQIEYVVKTIDEWLEENFPDIEPRRIVGCAMLNLDFDSDKEVVAHLKYMVIEIVEMANFSPDDYETREKLMRWLGFMQGALWSRGYYSLDDFRKMNKVEK